MGKTNKERAQEKAAANPLLHASKTPNLPPLQYLLTLFLTLFCQVSKPKDFLYVFISKEFSLPKKLLMIINITILCYLWIFIFVYNRDWAKKAGIFEP